MADLRPARAAFPALTAAFVVLTGSAAGQERVRSEAVRAPAKTEVTEGRRLFAGVGIDAYQRPEIWEKLENAKNDVTKVRDVLVEHYDFESPAEWVLLDDGARREDIFRLVDVLRGEVKPDDSLVFFFAGHGTELKHAVGGDVARIDGYLVPVDVKGRVEHVPSQYVKIEDLLEALAPLDVRHVFVVLDSCRSGLSLTGITKTRGSPTAGARDLMSRHSRRVLSSAMEDQNAADSGQLSSKNSRFTSWLVTALERAAAGETDGPTGDDGLLTATELFAFVRERVTEESNGTQTPVFGSFELDKNGELVLAIDRDEFDAVFMRAVEAFEAGARPAFAAAANDGLRLRAEGFASDYLRYLLGRVDKDSGTVLHSLREMRRRVEAGEKVPAVVSWSPLQLELDLLESLCEKSSCVVRKKGG